MKLRGERRCTSCDTRWSYYETGNVSCPGCGGLRSVGVDDPTTHTDLDVDFDLDSVRTLVDEVTREELAKEAGALCREYVRRRGFVSGGDLRDLDDTYLAAAELRHVAGVFERRRRPTEATSLYFLDLIETADGGERPGPDRVPSQLNEPRGLAYASAVREYRRDVRVWASESSSSADHPAVESPFSADERATLESLDDHAKRIQLLDGDVEPETAETLLVAAREAADGIRGETAALERARDAIDRLV